MKNSKKSRGSNSSRSPTRSIRKQAQPSSVRGLVTSKQQSIKTSSQVSGYTQKTEKSNTFAVSQDFDFADEDVEKDDVREVFVSEEEEKVIHKILEVARKGKINQKNAFQIPLKVLDNDHFSTGKTKFWKFASELLGASMSIYQKRIENTWISTNLIHDKLARMTVGKDKDDENDENEEQPRKPQLSEFLMLPIQQFRDPKILDNIRVGSQTLEVPEKINIPRIRQQFTDDPLFQKKIKTFDNTSLKGLLLNVFDISSLGQIELFCEENKLQLKDHAKMIKNQSCSSQQRKYLSQNIAVSKKNQSEGFFKYVWQFKRKNTFNKDPDEAYDSVGFVRKQNQYQQQQSKFAELDAFLNEPLETMYSQMPLADDLISNVESKDIKNFHEEDANTVGSQFGSYPQESLTLMSQNSPFNLYETSPFSQLEERQFHSVMNPWEIEFKQGKMRKKSVKRQKKEGIKREKVEPGLVGFDALQIENQKLTLKVQKSTKSKSRSKKGQTKKLNRNNNLIPPQLAVYEKANYKKIQQAHSRNEQVKAVRDNLPDFLAPDPSMLDGDPNNENQNNMHAPVDGPHNLNMANQEDILEITNQQGEQVLQRRHNIRETKKLIYEIVKDEREIRISDSHISGLSAASMLITFLHIANEKNMIVRNTPEEDDVILSWE